MPAHACRKSFITVTGGIYINIKLNLSFIGMYSCVKVGRYTFVLIFSLDFGFDHCTELCCLLNSTIFKANEKPFILSLLRCVFYAWHYTEHILAVLDTCNINCGEK